MDNDSNLDEITSQFTKKIGTEAGNRNSDETASEESIELNTEEIHNLKNRMPHHNQSASNLDSDLDRIREGRDSMHGEVKYRFKNDPKCFQNSESCFICDLPFGKLKNKRHHCRLCTKSCCKKCSESKIDKNRICDICDYKNTNRTFEIQKKQYLRDMSTRTKFLIDRIARDSQILEDKTKWKSKLDEKINILDVELRTKLDAYNDSLSSMKSVYETKLKEKQALELVVKSRQDQLNQSELKKKEVQSQVAILELDLQLLLKNLELKMDKKTSLESHVGDLDALQESLKTPAGTGDDEIKYELAMELLKKSAFLLEKNKEEDNRLSSMKTMKMTYEANGAPNVQMAPSVNDSEQLN